MKVLSLYCGAGGIDEGLKQSGILTTIAIDLNKDACETFKINHPNAEVICGKVGDYKESFSNCEIIVGGPPCPEFSRANAGRTYDTCEVNNFWSIVENNKPKYYLMENVQDVIKVLKRPNHLINCADYGTPQTRTRRFFTNLPLPKPTHAKTPSSDLLGGRLEKWVSVKDALGLDGIIEDRKTTFGEKYKKEAGKFRQYSTERPSNTIVTDSRQWYISPTGFKKKNQKEISRKIEEPSMTIVNANEYVLTDHKVMSEKYIAYRKTENITSTHERKLTNEELMILQGFSSDYVFYGSKSSVKEQIGNAVPRQPIIAIFKQIFEKGNEVAITN
jgi:DNA (cytosine-5)-methyltransferase 1